MLYRRLSALTRGEGTAAPGEAWNELRAVFEYAVAKMLEGDLRAFGTQYSRMVYLCSRCGAGERLRAAMTAFARRAAGEGPSSPQELSERLSELLYILYGFSGVRPDEEALSQLLSRCEQAVLSAPQGADSRPALSGLFSAVVTGVSPMRIQQARRYYQLEVLARAQGDVREEKYRIVVAESYPSGVIRGDLMRLREIVRPYWAVNITDLKQGATPSLLYTTADTLIVLEPDFLVDVTDIAACFDGEQANANIFLLSKLLPDRDSEAMLRGTLINDLLDAYLEDEKADPRTVFRQALSRNLLKAARYGGETVRRIWDTVVAEHRDNIAAFARGLRDQRVCVEPSFLSALYGMQGRLDVLTEYPDDPALKNIYELKSGRPPGGTALWPSHQVQVACYDMLLTSVYGPRRRGTSALFYSSASQYPVRNFLSSATDRQSIIALRNELIDRVYRLAEGDLSPLEALDAEHFGPSPAYLREALEQFASFYRGMSSWERKYYGAFLSFTLREMLAAKTGAFLRPGREGTATHGYASLWRDSYRRKRENYAVVDSLSLEWYDRREHVLHFAIRESVEHTLRAGDPVVLYPYRGQRDDVLHNRVVKGTLRAVENDRLEFVPRGARAELEYFRSEDRWVAEHDMMERGYWSSVAGMYTLFSSRSAARGAVAGTLRPGEADFPYREQPKLTPGQNAAVRGALRAREYFLLQGPPGTGKTSGALMGIVRNVLDCTRDTLTILAFTNRAVAEISDRLRRAEIDFLRLGHESAAQQDRTLSRVAEGMKINQLREYVSSRRVILSTVSAYVSRADDLKELFLRDVALVDEASQLTEVQLGGVLAGFRKFVLLGDQKQLPAVTLQSGAYARVEDPDLRAKGLFDLRDSLFERLWRYAEQQGYEGVRAMLDTHFRMHEQIAELVNPFYQGRLRSGTARQRACRQEPRLCFLPSQYEPVFKRHRGEAETVSRLLREIKQRYGKRFGADTVGVVTPWRAQVGVIRAQIEDDPQLSENVTVDTVERFQGGEKDIIVVSMAVFDPVQMQLVESADAQGEVDRKLNVTVSRAREQLIVLGYEPALQASVFYAQLLEKIRRGEK